MKTLNKIIPFLFVLLLVSCEDVFEEDISDDIIEVVSPKDNTTIESNVVNFQWNEIDGAKKYRLQVLDINETIVVDSLVAKTSLNIPLLTGSYQWKVRGENFAYESNYSPVSNFSMVTTDDLSNQQVVLTSPDNNVYKNSADVTIKWQKLAAATSYSVEVINTTTSESVYKAESTTETSVTLNSTNLTKDANYQWKVRGINSTSQTAQFSSRNFFIDTVVPGVPVNSLPAVNAIITNNVSTTFTWISPTDTGTIRSPLLYTIEFSNTSTFTTILFPTNNASTSYQRIFTTLGDYYWRIKTTDAAGNVSAYSAPFKFTVI
ncbi:hypothetical protein D0817_14840 [Flavobacterium cupreum]|uniref:Fibronectin type-III domain-containing protein n=1 Tax=Flavobacterium cupreum TaxID=2133766 RepID=A0A434A661_9FLAO|nr:hypothetical protein [Flavobacterium cupreum]RUT69888.1 hypothetical protein D0817_14840 [Flavobacterium cupreum]